MVTTEIETVLDQVTDALKDVVTRQQQSRDPVHDDFYVWGWALSELTARAQDVGLLLGRQVADYGSRRILRDDENGHDPIARLQEAGEYLQEMVAALERAKRAARAYHSAIGHIGVEVEVDPEA